MNWKPLVATLICAFPLAGCDGLATVAATTLLEQAGGGNTSGFSIVATNVDPSSTTVEAGGTVTLSVVTSAPADSYAWSATGGSLSSASGNPVSWTAPATAGTYRIDVKAKAGDKEAPGSFRLTVK